VLAIHLF
jgi:hypothetical protein